MAKAITEIAAVAIDEAAQAARAKILRRQKRAATLAQFWELTHLPSLDRAREGTRKQHVYRWEQWIAPHLGGLAWKQINAPRLAQWLATIQAAEMRGNAGRNGRKLSTRSIVNIFSTLSSVLSHAVAIGHLHASPCGPARRYLPKVTPSEQARRRERALTFEQARALVASTRLALWTRVEIAFAIYCCTRRGETHGLQWKHVRPKGTLRDPTPHIRIERSHSGPTKTDSSTRDVPLHPELARLLESYRKEWARRFGREPGDGDHVFPSPKGEMRAKSAGSRMKKITRTAGVPRITFHGLRHTGATLYRASGMRREDVAALLGHAGNITDLYAPPQLPFLWQEIQRLKLIDPTIYAPPNENDPEGGIPHGSAAVEDHNGSGLDASRSVEVEISPMPHPSSAGAQDAALVHDMCINPDNPQPFDAHPAAHRTHGATATIGQRPAPIVGYLSEELAALLGESDEPIRDTERDSAPKSAIDLLFDLWNEVPS